MPDGLFLTHDEDLAETLELLDREPLTNLFLSSRIGQAGLEPSRLGCPVWGFRRAGRLVAVCHDGTNCVPAGEDAEAIEAFAVQLAGRRRAQSIMGRSDVVAALHARLVELGPSWRRPREIRRHQPLLAIDQDPEVEADPRVRMITPETFLPYFRAAVAMYTEEVGVSPLDPSHSYQSYVLGLISSARAIGAVEGDRVWFKTDIGSLRDGRCQIQGVWLDPQLRGHRMSIPAMAAATRLARRQAGQVSLYVNDFNVRALRMYATVGFRQVGELGTVLY